MSWEIVQICALVASGLTLVVACHIGWHNARLQRAHHTVGSYVTLLIFLFFILMAFSHAAKVGYGLFRR